MATTLAIAGAGSLGQSFAGLLASSGRAVALLASPRTAAQLLKAGRIVLQGVVEREVVAGPPPARPGMVAVTDDLRELPERSGLIFMAKGHQLPELIGSVRDAWPRAGDDESWVAGVQNGIVKDDLLMDAFGRGRVVGAVTILGAQRTPDGPVTVTSLGATYLGEFPRGTSARVRDAVEQLRAAGIPADASEDIRSVLWSKMCNATGVFGVSVLTRASAGGLGRSPHLVRAYLSLVRETADVARAEGAGLGDYAGFPIKTYVERPEEEVLATFAERARLSGPRGGPESLPSMTQDLLAGRPMEVEAIFGDVVERAMRHGVLAPCLTLVRDLLRGINPG